LTSLLQVAVSGSGVSIKAKDLEWYLLRDINAGIMLDAWVIRAMYRLDESGSRMYGGDPITLLNSAWEVAVLESGEDFMGCLHGHHVQTAASLWVDGVSRSMTTPANYAGRTVEIRQSSDLYLWSDNSKCATIETVWEWTPGQSLTQRSSVDWLQTVSSNAAYLGMLPIVRKIGTTQITSSATFHPSQITYDVSETGHGVGAKAGETGVRIFDLDECIDFDVKHSIESGSINFMFIQDTAEYNKVYANYTATGPTAGDAWDITTRYRWNN
jgi:hypothetical protein